MYKEAACHDVQSDQILLNILSTALPSDSKGEAESLTSLCIWHDSSGILAYPPLWQNSKLALKVDRINTFVKVDNLLDNSRCSVIDNCSLRAIIKVTTHKQKNTSYILLLTYQFWRFSQPQTWQVAVHFHSLLLTTTS
jgi:hypothetical protein